MSSIFTIQKDARVGDLADGRRIVDTTWNASLSVITKETARGEALFLLEWGNRMIPVVTTSKHAVDGSGLNQIHVHIRAVGSSRAADNADLQGTELSVEELPMAQRLASEALLVFGGWFDGPSYPDGYYVIHGVVNGQPKSYTLSSFRYAGASRPPDYHHQLEANLTKVRERTLEEAWGLATIDKALVVELHNVKWFPHQQMEMRDVLTAADVLLPGLPTISVEVLQGRARALVTVASRYGSAHIEGEDAKRVTARMEVDHPGFSRESYRKALAHGIFSVRAGRQYEWNRRQERIAAARSAAILDAVFELHFFNLRYARHNFYGKIPVHEVLGGIHSTEMIDEPIIKTDELLNRGRQLSYPTSDAAEILMREHPGFSRRHINATVNWGFETNR